MERVLSNKVTGCYTVTDYQNVGSLDPELKLTAVIVTDNDSANNDICQQRVLLLYS